jgi:PhnB protein
MKVNPIPTKYNRVMPYLTIPNAAEFIQFTKTVFGAQEMGRMGPPGGPIMHGEIKIADSVIMFSDATQDNPAESPVLMIYVENVDETYKVALAAGAKSRGEPTNQFYGDRIAKIQDSNGIHWAISSRLEDLTEDEMRKRAKQHRWFWI